MGKDDVINRLRGQLQNCVNHLELLKRHGYHSDAPKIDACVDSANKALYETLVNPSSPWIAEPPSEPKSLTAREKWLMHEAFVAGYERGHHDTVESQYSFDHYQCCTDWLSDMAADAVTVEMALVKEANRQWQGPLRPTE